MSDLPLLETVEVDSATPAQAAVIWLHGLGADGNDFPPIVAELGLAPDAPIRWIFPHAEVRPVTINMGMSMRAWYDIEMMDTARHYPDDDIFRSTAQIEALIAREKDRGIPASRIVLAGFSQGGAIALHTALRHEEALAGVVALSTYLVRGDELAEERSEANAQIPVFQAHGTHDQMVRYAWGEALRDRLRELDYRVDFHDYPMEHNVVLEEIQDLGRWFQEHLAGDLT
jgi:phospholipase/carboxylesterase